MSQPHSICSALYLIGKDKPREIADFIKEEGITSLTKHGPNSALANIAFHDPSRRDEVIQLFGDILQFVINSPDPQQTIDLNTTAMIVNEVKYLGGIELLPQIETLISMDRVNTPICGDVNSLKEEMAEIQDYELFRCSTDPYKMARQII